MQDSRSETLKYKTLGAGDPAPWFIQRTVLQPNFSFSSVGGRYVLLCFFGSAAMPAGQAAVSGVMASRHLFDDEKACFFGVSLDPSDEAEGRTPDLPVGIRYFRDYDGRASRAYGVLPLDPAIAIGADVTRGYWVLTDPTLRVVRTFPLDPHGDNLAEIMTFVANLPPPELFAGLQLQAPILFLPNVFELELCERLIRLYDSHGGEITGFMSQVDGRTVGIVDHSQKVRADHIIEDAGLIKVLHNRIVRHIVPEIAKVHQFAVTRIERHIVGCYTAEDGGHFVAHRDNTTAGTAHRRFAVSINLNDDFDGGEICFPEYGPRTFKPPAGGAVVFSCSLLHRVTRMQRGNRYAFLPFLYDDAAAALRAANVHLLDNGAAPQAILE